MNEQLTWISIGVLAFGVLCIILFYLRTSKAKDAEVTRTENLDTQVNSAPAKNTKKI